MDVEIIAHRGSSFLAPENTLFAAQLAWQEGADAVEGDFRLSKDGHIICIHDASLKRIAGIDHLVADCTLDELRTFDVGLWKGEQFAGLCIPTLKELLATVPAGKRFFVEVKCGPDILDPLASVIEECHLSPQQICLICLQPGIVQRIKERIPQCPAYWVVDFKQITTDSWAPGIDDVLLLAQGIAVDGLDLMATGPLDVGFVKRAKAAGQSLCVWTVDDPSLGRHIIGLGIQSITTNRPGWLRNQLRC
jgi:glycerophosphoryl diester phosphodiesterase